MVTCTEYIDSDDKDSVMPPLIYLEAYDNNNYTRNPTSAEPTPETGPLSEKPTKEPTSEPDYDPLPEPYAPTREGSMGHLAPKYIARYQKGSYPPRFSTLEERTKEAP